MGLSERTLNRLRKESEEVGGKVYDDDEDVLEEDVTHFDEDNDPLTNVGDVDDENEAPVGEVPGREDR